MPSVRRGVAHGVGRARLAHRGAFPKRSGMHETSMHTAFGALWNHEVTDQCMWAGAPAASLTRPALSVVMWARAFPPLSSGRRSCCHSAGSSRAYAAAPHSRRPSRRHGAAFRRSRATASAYPVPPARGNASGRLDGQQPQPAVLVVIRPVHNLRHSIGVGWMAECLNVADMRMP